MLNKTFEKIQEQEKIQFLMPLSLRLIKECANKNINWKDLHFVDLMSIIISMRIDDANKYLREKRQERMSQRGIQSISKATEEDFDKL